MAGLHEDTGGLPFVQDFPSARLGTCMSEAPPIYRRASLSTGRWQRMAC